MSKAKLVITAVVQGGMTQAEAASTYGVSKGWVSKLLARYRAEGEAAFEELTLDTTKRYQGTGRPPGPPPKPRNP